MNQDRVNMDIPLARYRDVLSWDQPTIDRLVEASVRLAVQVGIRIDNDEEGVYLSEAETRGCKVDWSARAVGFDEADVLKTIEIMRQTRPIDNSAVDRCSTIGRDEKFMPGNGANLLFDWDKWTARAASAEDLVDLCHWAQGCDDVGSLFPPVMLKHIDLRLAPIYSYALTCQHCHKTVYHEQPTEPIHVRYLEKRRQGTVDFWHARQGPAPPACFGYRRDLGRARREFPPREDPSLFPDFAFGDTNRLSPVLSPVLIRRDGKSIRSRSSSHENHRRQDGPADRPVHQRPFSEQGPASA